MRSCWRVEWFGAHALQSLVQDLMLTRKNKSSAQRRCFSFDIRTKNVDFHAGFANMFIVFARIEEDKNITGFIVPNDPENGITLGMKKKNWEFTPPQHVRCFLMKQKYQLTICWQDEEMDSRLL